MLFIYIAVFRFPWCKLKPLLRHKLDLVLKDFQQRCPVDGQTPCPNVENVKFDEMHERLLTSLDQFTGFVNRIHLILIFSSFGMLPVMGIQIS